MAGAGTGYDLSVGTFSSDGRLFQVEYACKAIDNSGTAIGICCKDGVVVGVEKILAYRMMEKGSDLSLIHISEPTRLLSISYAVFCLKKKKPSTNKQDPKHVQ
eukprot:TRINITY_DN36130_c0_g1_i1.p2 TRINITY_DN36130_c0_g1~~TRINITY_DN36130_c0_g1_i1.p2  ORF type:complete len:103 (+),score=28.91 TRINITY_DN36130_c0_g1_i1:151-459(+)